MQVTALQGDLKLVEQGQQLRNTCLNNLRQIDAAKQQWALANSKTSDATPTVQEIAPYLPGNALPVCPAGGTYTLNAMNKLPTCSIPGHALQ